MKHDSDAKKSKLAKDGNLGFLSRFRTTHAYALILLSIMLTYWISATAPTAFAPTVLIVELFTLLGVFRVAGAKNLRKVVLLWVTLIIASTVFSQLHFVNDSQSIAAVYLVSALLYLYAPVLLLRHILQRGTIDNESLLGAVSGYLLLGVGFAFFFQFLQMSQTAQTFNVTGQASMADILFFSFSGLTTVGWSTILPIGDLSQFTSILETVIGSMFLIGAVGKIVSAWNPAVTAAAAPDPGTDPKAPPA